MIILDDLFSLCYYDRRFHRHRQMLHESYDAIPYRAYEPTRHPRM
jgi:hypothetical protein